MPGWPDFVATNRVLHAIVRVLSVLFRTTRLTGLRIADLGCLEGGFAFALAQRGATALGIEARRANVEKGLLLKEHFEMPNLDFQVGDVKDFTLDRYGAFDAIVALGILYHLDNPVQWLSQISKATLGVLIVDTHYAPETQGALEMMHPELRAPLGDLETVTVDGRTWQGRSFVEYSEGTDPEDLLWSAYSNSQSFWLTKESLLGAMLHAGFDLVLEQHDYSAPEYARLTKTWPRGMFVGIRSRHFAP